MKTLDTFLNGRFLFVELVGCVEGINRKAEVNLLLLKTAKTR